MFWIQSKLRKLCAFQTSLSLSRCWYIDSLGGAGEPSASLHREDPIPWRRSKPGPPSSAVSRSHSGGAVGRKCHAGPDNSQARKHLENQEEGDRRQGLSRTLWQEGPLMWGAAHTAGKGGPGLQWGWGSGKGWASKVGGSGANHSTTVQRAVGNMAGFQFKRNVYAIKYLFNNSSLLLKNLAHTSHFISFQPSWLQPIRN